MEKMNPEIFAHIIYKMKKFHYHNTERRIHQGKHITRKVHIKHNKGYKSVTIKGGGRNRSVRRALKKHEIEDIKKGKFIRGLFSECKLRE